MGSIVKARCECGYESEEMFLGGGFLNFETELSAPAYCGHCGRLVISNYLDEKAACPECSHRVTFYNYKSLNERGSGNAIVFDWNAGGRKFVLYDRNYLCPKCRCMKMRFEAVGCWD